LTRYIVRRLLLLPFLLVAVTIVIYLLVNLAPGDPVSLMINPELPKSVGDVQRERLGLNKPVYERYFLWLGQVLRGNLGYSYADRQPVARKIMSHLGATVVLMGSGLVLALLFGITLGIYAAVKRYSLPDYLLTFGAFGAVSIPHFFLGLMLLYLFSLKLRVMPAGGMFEMSGEHSVSELARHLVLPAIVLATEQLAIFMRLIRGSLLEVLGSDFIRTARAKGLRERVIVLRHALPNSLLPVLTHLGFSLGWVFGGAVVTEQVFSWPGIGQLTIHALMTRDYPVIMGINLVAASLVIIGNLLADIAYTVADPRIRYG
jgi:peptide/nickel transport system permease protein